MNKYCILFSNQMEPQKRCISYWDDPLERCTNLGEKSFCDAHSFHYRYYSNYKNMSLVRPKTISKKNLIALQAEIDARLTFKEKAICVECRDTGHDFFIDQLLCEKNQMEEILALEALLTEPEKPSELEVEIDPEPENKSDDENWVTKAPKKISAPVNYSVLLDKHEKLTIISYQESIKICSALGWSEEEIIGLGFLFYQTQKCGTLFIRPYSSKIEGFARRLSLIQYGMSIIGYNFRNATIVNIPEERSIQYRRLASWFISSSETLWFRYQTKFAWLTFLWDKIPNNFSSKSILILSIKNNVLHVEMQPASLDGIPPSLKTLYQKKHDYIKRDKFLFTFWVTNTMKSRLDVLCKITNKDLRLQKLEPDLKLFAKILNFIKKH